MTRRYGGTGLGLAISKRLCEIMGGKMWVDSQANIGSTFHFTVIVPVETQAMEHSMRRETELIGHQVLLIVSNVNLRKCLTTELQTLGLNVRAIASNATIQQYLWQQHPFSLAILDIDSPELNISNLIAKIRVIPKQKYLPLVMLSSKGKHTLEVKQLSAEFTAFLHKPVHQYQLKNTILQTIRGSYFSNINSPSIIPSYSRLPTADWPIIDTQLAEILPLKILLVEDILINQKIALKMLHRLGYRVDVANNGCEALEALQRQLYDLVFMDIQMPEMDGWEATHRIRAEFSENAQPWIIAMTAHVYMGAREQCLVAGMNDYISKPISLEGLETVLKQYATQQNQTSPLPIHHDELIPINPSSVLDPSVLKDLYNMAGSDGAILIAELVQVYLEDAPVKIQDIKDAAISENQVKLKKAAHALRSPSVSIGAVGLGNICETLECKLENQSSVQISNLINQLDSEYQNLITALENFQKSC